MRLSAGRAGLRNLARFRRAAIVGIAIAAALALAGMTCASADEPPPTTPVAAVGLDAMSGRAVKLTSPGPADGERFIALSVGKYHNCALREDRQALCWGRNSDGQLDAPDDERFVAISAGGHHTCGLREDGAARCWGRWGVQGPPAHSVLDERFVAISTGSHHTCGIRENGAVVCWGVVSSEGNIGQWSPSGETFVAIFSQYSLTTCGINTDGISLCWANALTDPPFRRYGEKRLASLGRGSGCGLKISGEIICHIDPNYDPLSGERIRFMGSSWEQDDHGYMCGIQPDGSAACWDVNKGSEQDRNIAKIPATQKFLGIGTGPDHACGLLADGSIICWGDNRDGLASPPPTQFVPTPAPPTDVICNPGVVIMKGSGCRLPKSIKSEVRRFAVTTDGRGVVYDDSDAIYEIRHVSIDISFHGTPVLVEDGWYRLKPRREDGPWCEGAGNAYDFSGHQLWGFSDTAQRSSTHRVIVNTCIILAAKADANGDWVVNKTLVWNTYW